MRTWLREILGLALVFAGLFVWLLCLGMLQNQELIQGSMAFFIGMMVFRGGVHFMKTGLAAHILLSHEREMTEERRKRTQRP